MALLKVSKGLPEIFKALLKISKVLLKISGMFFTGSEGLIQLTFYGIRWEISQTHVRIHG